MTCGASRWTSAAAGRYGPMPAGRLPPVQDAIDHGSKSPASDITKNRIANPDCAAAAIPWNADDELPVLQAGGPWSRRRSARDSLTSGVALRRR